MDVVLLDFDGTITRRDTTKMFVFRLLQAFPWRVFRVLGPLCRLAIGGSEQQTQRAKVRCLGGLLRELSEEQVQPVLLRFHRDALALIRPELALLMRERAESGQQVLVVTASAEGAVREALRDFQVTVLGMRFDVRQGRFTGAVGDEGCYGAAKVLRIHAWSKAQPTRPHFVEAWSDSLSDLPMMKLAKKRVWVCPTTDVTSILARDPEGSVVQID